LQKPNSTFADHRARRKRFNRLLKKSRV